MTEERAFIDALLVPTGEDETPLVYADWLEEHGQADRALLMRVQAEYATTRTSEVAERMCEALERCNAALPLSASLRARLGLYWRHGLLWASLLEGGRWSQDDLDELADIPFLTTLSNVQRLPPELLARLSGCPNIRCLKQGTLPALTATQIQAIGGLAHLESLALNGPSGTDPGLAHLHPLKRLRAFDLSGSYVTDEGTPRLRPLTGLKDLSLAICRQVGDPGLAPLAGLAGLESLSLSGTAVTDAGLGHLAGLHELRSLDISETGVAGSGLEAVSRLTKLTSLNLSRNEGIDDTHILHLARLPALRDLDISFTRVTRAHLPRLIEATSLKRLRTGGSPASNRRGRAAQAFLAACKEQDVLVDTDWE